MTLICLKTPWTSLSHSTISGIASWSHVNSVQNCVLIWRYAKYQTFQIIKINFPQPPLPWSSYQRVCTLYQIHATQRSRDKRLTEGRTRPKTDPTYCICSSGVNSYKVALKIVMFKLIFQYFMQNTQHWSWYLRVCTLQQIHATQRSWDKLLM